MEESDEEVVQCMELLEGNYQLFRQWVPPAPRFWDSPPKVVVKIAIVRYAIDTGSYCLNGYRNEQLSIVIKYYLVWCIYLLIAFFHHAIFKYC